MRARAPSLGARASVHSSSSQSLFKHQPDSLNQMHRVPGAIKIRVTTCHQNQSQSQSQSQIVSHHSARARAPLGARASVHSSSSQSLFKHQPPRHSLNHSQMTDSSSSESLSESESKSESESESESDRFRSERERGRPSLGRPRERDPVSQISS